MMSAAARAASFPGCAARYDVSKFSSFHPGGPNVLVRLIERLFARFLAGTWLRKRFECRRDTRGPTARSHSTHCTSLLCLTSTSISSSGRSRGTPIRPLRRAWTIPTRAPNSAAQTYRMRSPTGTTEPPSRTTARHTRYLSLGHLRRASPLSPHSSTSLTPFCLVAGAPAVHPRLGREASVAEAGAHCGRVFVRVCVRACERARVCVPACGACTRV